MWNCSSSLKNGAHLLLARIADLHEDMAAEQKARATYEYLIQLSDDPGVTETLQFLRQREVVHYQRFGETLDHIYDYYGKNRFCLFISFALRYCSD